LPAVVEHLESTEQPDAHTSDGTPARRSARSARSQLSISSPAHSGAMTPIEQAILALVAAKRGDDVAAQAHISRAQRHARANARRERQVIEIAALVVGGDGERAAGLALEHTAEFPEDVDLLARVAACK